MNHLLSNNQTDRDNQQERLVAGWIVGFVDGEGCFSISIFRNKTTTLGWQVLPEFVVTQGASSLSALELIKDYFKCGNIFRNKRYDNHSEDIYRYCVRRRSDLRETIIPFFQQFPLKTAKSKDFRNFVWAVDQLKQGLHLQASGLQTIANRFQKTLA